MMSEVGAKSFFRGWPIVYDGSNWRYEDTGDLSGFDGILRPCKRCGCTFEGSNAGDPDPCLGELPGVDNACCGHGERSQAYIRFSNGLVIDGFEIKGCG